MDAKYGFAKVSCTVNIVFKMATSTHAQFPIFPEESWVIDYPDMCWIRVDGQIRFECGYVWENQGKENMRNPIGKRAGVVSHILSVSFFLG